VEKVNSRHLKSTLLLGRPGTRGCALQQFPERGIRYDLMQGMISGLVGTDLDQHGGTPEGNCLAYANTFARVLRSVGIEAEAQYVRGEGDGRFITRVMRFIDPLVNGHIYYAGARVPHYYMFSSHVATWVPSLGMFYDPMACTKYAKLCSERSMRGGRRWHRDAAHANGSSVRGKRRQPHVD